MQVFDLAANKRDPVSKQKIHAKAGLTRISFNTHHPVLLIGDDRSACSPADCLLLQRRTLFACSEGKCTAPYQKILMIPAAS